MSKTSGPQTFATEQFRDAAEAVARLHAIYDANTGLLRDAFRAYSRGEEPAKRVRACYPYLSVRVEDFSRADTRLSYGFVDRPGSFSTTITRPSLFHRYLTEQVGQIIHNHHVPVEIGVSDTPIPIHFAFPDGMHVEGDLTRERMLHMRAVFDLPDLAMMDDSIVNGTALIPPDEPHPLALFTAPRADYSLFRLKHYTATGCEHFQNFVLFTNYQFYIDEFIRIAYELMQGDGGGYDAFVEPGDRITLPGGRARGAPAARLPQMPAYHLTRPDHSGITMVNIGVGPSNAKTITDHIAVLRPHAWIMLGHCAGLRNTQKLGDYVLAHGYVREDHVLDADLPVWVPVPALAEIQVALERAVGEITGLSGYGLKSVMRTGTVATIDNRNWELRDYREPVQRFSQSRAIALDMESATIAANGFRFRVPYGTLLCVSDKPLHGELKLPGMADAFYKQQVGQHLQIGIRAMERLRELGLEQLHSRKLRSFAEVAFQ
ncbi:AMP nucleosidase [Inquilinus limosus]|uniref:AMP nucleosidase n=2 Tax=Inquilinus limosus TaxID=171674 RepID=A0A211ZPH8_9PROT|nr:AMP nucleosidase [Inquilinus limosus]OWJ66997.1 AMP nucleosidase [Inquilinus limosus]